MWFTRVSIANPVLATMVMLAFVVMGLFSYQRLSVDQFPNVDFPTVVVAMDYPGASPEIVEAEVTKKIEEAVNTIAGINSLYSRSYEGSSVVIVEFNLDVDGRKAAEDVREKVALIRPLLRDEVKEPRISRFDPASQPVFNVAVLAADGSRSAQDLTTWATQVLRKRLENVRGVGAVTVVGGVERQVHLYLRPAAMESLGVTVDQVLAAVRSENQELPMGAIRSGEQERVVQINARLRNPVEFRDIVVARKQGVAVRLWQVADVVDGPQEVESLALYNGQRTVLLSVQKSQGENTIAVVDGLYRALEGVKAVTPSGIRTEVNRDNSRSIRVSVANVQRTLVEGAVLTILIVFLFLNSWRSTVITGLTLPIALIGTFAFMHAFGFTINTITLMALSLCVGLLIDDAIVVRENIVRHVQMGKTPRQASLDGTHEIGLAVLATTLSIVAVFLPIGFMGGIIGKFFHEFGITIVAAVLISMFVSFTLDPMLSSVWHDPTIHRGHLPAAAGAHGAAPPPRTAYDRTIGRVTGAFERFTDWLSDRYQAILGWSLGHRLATLGIAAASFGASFAIIPMLGAEFVPKADFSETQVNFYTPVGSSLEVTEQRARQIDAALRRLPEVKYTVTTINSGFTQGKMYGTVYVRFVDRKDRRQSIAQLTPAMREQLGTIPGVTITNIGVTDLGGSKSLVFSIQGPDLAELERLSGQVMARLRDIPGLVDLDSTLKPDKPTVSIDVKRDAAADVGLNVNALAGTLRTMVAGTNVGTWRASDGETYDVLVRLTPESRHSIDDLRRLPISVGAGPDGSPRMVRLSQVAEVRPSTGLNQINRRDLNREINIDANALGRSTGDVATDIRRVLDGIAWPPGYRYSFGGSTKNMQESFGYAVGALGLAVIFIYMILASQFKSFIQPIALMSSLPLTLIGVVLALLAFRSTLNMFSVIGVVMLMGLVTKNAILLVDFAIRSREGSVDTGAPPLGDGRWTPLARADALLHAARVRLRPILMTTLAMVFGMVPLAFALTEGSEQRAPMGQAVIGGVITSSLLTLVVVPVVYCYLDDLAAWARRGFRRAGAEPSTAADSVIERKGAVKGAA
jgi:hydrophobic/amphiphilic exporter-1 (mainly G- bacteria), HAE1 family